MISKVLLCLLLCAPVLFGEASEAPYVDSKAIKERFEQITAADMDLLRQKKILIASRSFGLNLCKGLGQLAKQDKKYDLLSSYERFDVFKAGSDLSIIPADAFQNKNFIHFMCTHWPPGKRIEEMGALLTKPPHEFGKTVDVVYLLYDIAPASIYENYAAAMESWHAAFPNARFIYGTCGFRGPKYATDNEDCFLFGEKVRQNLKGKVPIYDLGAIMSDDFRAGHVYCPEYSADPAEVHPNLPAGETMMAKGFLLILKETLAQNPEPAAQKN